VTSAGPVRLRRTHFACPGCAWSGYAADEALGLGGYLSPRALRLAVSDLSFAAAVYLREFCGIAVAAETLRLACERHWQHAAWGLRRGCGKEPGPRCRAPPDEVAGGACGGGAAGGRAAAAGQHSI
jgi:hypothetical protein